jgi:hypothetical protein
MAGSEDQSTATVQLPEWVAGSNVANFLEQCMWAGSQASAPGEWDVRPIRSNEADYEPLLSEAFLIDMFRQVPRTARARINGTEGIEPYLEGERIAGAFEELAKRDDLHQGDLANWIAGVVTATQTAPSHQLLAMIEAMVRQRLRTNVERPSARAVFANPSLGKRYTAVRMLMQVAEDPELLRQGPKEFRGFEPGRALLADPGYNFGAYLHPLFLSLSPWFWGFSVPRPGFVVAYSLGRTVAGIRSSASDPLDVLAPLGWVPKPENVPARPEPAAAHLQEAIRWWVRHLNTLFERITDPRMHLDRNGRFDVRIAFERLLSVEQVFRSVEAILSDPRNQHARRALLFQFLDTMEGLGQSSPTEMMNLSHAKKVLDKLELCIPAHVRSVLLPNARAGLEALSAVRDGFFPSPRRVGDMVNIAGPRQAPLMVGMDKAVSYYLRAIRNAHHGFGGNHSNWQREAALLASHNGEIPDTVVLLAWLYLLRIVAMPEVLRWN